MQFLRISRKNKLNSTQAWTDNVIRQFGSDAEQFLSLAEDEIGAVSSLKKVPQVAKSELTGKTVFERVLRQIAIIKGLEEQESLLHIEALASDKSLHGHAMILQRTIQEQAATLMAWSVLSVIRTVECVVFSAPQGSKAEKYGLFQHDYRASDCADNKELAVYDKLLRSFEAAHPDLSEQELATAFYAEYQIDILYPSQSAVTSPNYWKTTKAFLDSLRLGARDQALLQFLLRETFTINKLNIQRSAEYIKILEKKSTIAGLDPGDVVDAMTAIIFLLEVTGLLSKHTVHDSSAHRNKLSDLEILKNFWRALDLSAPNRPHQRRKQVRILSQQRKKRVLAELDLDPNQLMTEIDLPHDDTRAAFAKDLYALIEGQMNLLRFLHKYPKLHTVEQELAEAAAIYQHRYL